MRSPEYGLRETFVTPRLIDPTSILFGPETRSFPMKERTMMLEKISRYSGDGVGAATLVGPPGVGKSKIIHALSESGDIGILPLLTTRQAVAGEDSSHDRTFVTTDTFDTMKQANELLAISAKSGAQGDYQMAIDKATLRDISGGIRPFILDKTFAGWERLLLEMEDDPNLKEVKNKILTSHHYIFILPPDLLTLIRRLYHRNRTTSLQSLKEERREELKRAKELDKLLEDSKVPNISYIVNDDVSRVTTEIRRILHIV